MPPCSVSGPKYYKIQGKPNFEHFDGLPARKYMVLLGHDRTLREPYSETRINFIMSEFSCCPSRPCAFIEIEHLSCVLLRMLSTNSLTGE